MAGFVVSSVFSVRFRGCAVRRMGLVVMALGLFGFAVRSHGAPPVTSGLQFQVQADTGVVAIGNAVISWLDLSGNGGHVTNYTAVERPLLIDDALHHKPVIRFDGVTNMLNNLSRPMSSIISASDYTVFVILRANGFSQTGGDVWEQDTVIGDNMGFFGVIVQSNLSTSIKSVSMYNYDVNADVAEVLAGFDPTDYLLFVGSHGSNTTLSAQVVGYGSPVTVASGATGGLAGILQVGRGYASGGTTSFKGDIAEILIYNRLLIGAEITSIRNYLVASWLRDPPKGAIFQIL